MQEVDDDDDQMHWSVLKAVTGVKEKVKKDIEYTKLNHHDDEVVVYVCLRGGVCVVVKRFLVKKGNWIFI